VRWGSNLLVQLTLITVTLYQLAVHLVVPKRRNHQPVQQKQYEVLYVQEEKFKVEIEKLKLENIKLQLEI
jgi:hypothetical protein